MKFATLLMFRVTRLALVLWGSTSLIACLVLLISLLFFHPPYFAFGKTTYGLSAFMHGYPISTTHKYSRQTGNLMNLDNMGQVLPAGFSLQTAGYNGFVPTYQLNQQTSRIKWESFEKHTVYVQPSNRREMLMTELPFILRYSAIALSCILSILVVNSIQKGKPFFRHNPRRVMFIGITLLAMEILLFFTGLWQKTEAPAAFGFPPSYVPDSPFVYQWFLAGLILLMISITLSRGRMMKKLNKKTI